MPGSRSSALLASALAVAAALVAGGCATRDPEVRPFRISAVDATGAALGAGATALSLLTVSGAASRPDPATLVVTPASGPAVTFRFEPGAPPGDRFPDVVASGAVKVDLLQDPASRGPGGAPLPYRGLRIADANGRYRFFLGEGDLEDEQGLPLVPRPLGPEASSDDLPLLLVVSPGTRYEPSSCGDVYRDRLLVGGAAEELVLAEGDTASVALTGSGDLPPWSLRLVAAWHRVDPEGGRGCEGALHAWFQAAGAR